MAAKVEADKHTNTFDPKRVEKLVRDLETIAEEFTSHKMAHMASCKPFHERRAAKLEEAAAFGIPKKIMKAKLNERALRRKLDGVADDFEDDDRETFEQVSQALGDYADLPLGKAAVDAAKTEKPQRGRPRKAPSAKDASAAPPPASNDATSDDREPDLRSDSQKLAEQQRLDEAARVAAENADKITGGIKPLTH